ncbi:DUF1415 domain-containing protein [Rhodoferax aquaticus]|uniref:DUF1415 domain-containing protein n=1 Tax=Rhodoferax aquaticus TaxID=2527691 RepID=A0A515ELJ1_9BURK|nr:DUF1415 domain-containing protein [Rhodoferax aquaticus]QDL53532.1 DUF1415 domain-containing protein [Rhodoferax aquaticus]
MQSSDIAERAIQDTVRWIEKAVIGLNLCPFAKSVHVKGQIHYAVSAALTPEELLQDLESELGQLRALDAKARDTTLLIAVSCLSDFYEYNAFLERADRLLVRLDAQDDFQIASMHPQYQFAGTSPDDITNYTNRSPYPTLHLLRESSIDRAVQAFPDASAIFETNMETMTALGLEGWQGLDVGPHPVIS